MKVILQTSAILGKLWLIVKWLCYLIVEQSVKAGWLPKESGQVRDRSGYPFLPAFGAKKIVTNSPDKCLIMLQKFTAQ
jgi:hypothetical protein